MAKASSKGASSKTSVQYRALLHYERQWLPPLSPANVFGAALFFFYVGSAVLSAFKPHGAPMSTFTRAKEIAACTAMPPLNTSCLGHAPPRAAGSGTSPVRRTLYMQPYGALGSRLRGVASGLTLGEEVGADVVIVWRDSEYGFTGAWSDLFAAPALPLGCFPGQSLLPESAKCTIHTVNHHSEWEAVKDRWEQMPDGAGGVREVLCLKSVMYLTPKQREVGWFYKLLEPAASIKSRIDAFMAEQRWYEGGVAWVGVHARRTDLMLKCTTANCKEGLAVEQALPLSRFTDVMKAVSQLTPGRMPRFYLATDDPEAEASMQQELMEWATAGSGAVNGSAMATNSHSARHGGLAPVVSMPKAVRDASGDWLAMRSVVSGVQEAVADLYLLSRAQVLVGTVGSTFSQTAKLMGDAFFLTVGVEYENKV